MVRIELGRQWLPLAELEDLPPGSVLRTDRAVDESVDVLANGRIIARGRLTDVDGCFAVVIREVLNGVGAP